MPIDITDQMITEFETAGTDGSGNITDTRAGLTAALTHYITHIEGPRGTGLCDCNDPYSPPTGPNGHHLDHHCDCRTVLVAAMLLGRYSETVHAKQCGHPASSDEFYERRRPRS